MTTHSISPTWPARHTFWRDKRVLVTGGSGFLGSFVVDKLRERGVAEIIAPRRKEYDLRDIAAIRQLFADAQSRNTQHATPLYVIHLAAHVGGIGANGPSRPSSSELALTVRRVHHMAC